NRRCTGRSAPGGGTCTVYLVRAQYLPKPAFDLGHVLTQGAGRAGGRHRGDASSLLDSPNAKHHPLPALPDRGGGFIVAVPSKRAVIGSSGIWAQLSAFMNSSQRR